MQVLERVRQRVGVWLDDEAVDAVFHEVHGFAGIATRHDRLSRLEGLDHDEPVVFLHRHERHRNRARKQIDQLLVTDAPQELNPAVVAGQRAELLFVFASPGDLERDVAVETLHRSNHEIRALPPVETTGKKEVLGPVSAV